MTLLVLTGVVRRLRGRVVGRGGGAAGDPGAKITHFNLQNYILSSRSSSSSSSSVEAFGRQGWMDGWMSRPLTRSEGLLQVSISASPHPRQTAQWTHSVPSLVFFLAVCSCEARKLIKR